MSDAYTSYDLKEGLSKLPELFVGANVIHLYINTPNLMEYLLGHKDCYDSVGTASETVSEIDPLENISKLIEDNIAHYEASIKPKGDDWSSNLIASFNKLTHYSPKVIFHLGNDEIIEGYKDKLLKGIKPFEKYVSIIKGKPTGKDSEIEKPKTNIIDKHKRNLCIFKYNFFKTYTWTDNFGLDSSDEPISIIKKQTHTLIDVIAYAIIKKITNDSSSVE